MKPRKPRVKLITLPPLPKKPARARTPKAAKKTVKKTTKKTVKKTAVKKKPIAPLPKNQPPKPVKPVKPVKRKRVSPAAKAVEKAKKLAPVDNAPKSGLNLRLLLLGLGALGGLVLLTRKGDAKLAPKQPEPLPVDKPLVTPEPKPEPAIMESGITTVSSKAPSGKPMTTVSRFDGYKRAASGLPIASIAAAQEAIGAAKGKPSSELVGTVFKEGDGWAVVYEHHYNETKGVHLGASVFLRR